MSLTFAEQAALRFPARLTTLLRQPETFQALLTVSERDDEILHRLEEQTGISLKYSSISAPNEQFRGRIDETIRFLVERLYWNANQVADYLAQTYNM